MSLTLKEIANLEELDNPLKKMYIAYYNTAITAAQKALDESLSPSYREYYAGYSERCYAGYESGKKKHAKKGESTCT